jgi:hypothetical protein
MFNNCRPMLHAGARVVQLLLPTSYAIKKYMTNASLEGETAQKKADFATIILAYCDQPRGIVVRVSDC